MRERAGADRAISRAPREFSKAGHWRAADSTNTAREPAYILLPNIESCSGRCGSYFMVCETSIAYQEWKVRQEMKRSLIALTACAVLCAVPGMAFADHDDVGIAVIGGIVGGIVGSTLGAPAVYASPPAVVYAPPPAVVYTPPPEVVYTPPPVVIQQPYYAAYPYYAPYSYYRGDHHVRWSRHWRHHDDDDD